MSLADFRRARRATARSIASRLASGNPSPQDIAILRATLALMDYSLSRQGSALAMRRRIEGPTAFMTWQREMIALATRRFVRPLDWPAIRTRYDAYLREAQRWNERARRVRRYEDPYNGLVWIIRANAQELDAIDAMAAGLISWATLHMTDADFPSRPVRSGAVEFLSGRHDLIAALRMAQRQPPDVEVMRVPVRVPPFVEAVEFAIGLIPVVGSMVSAYEAYSGRNLFGYRLSPLERGVLGATVLLPIAGRLVRGGRALYTTERMVRLYGSDARTWSRVLAAGERASARGGALGTIRRAGTELQQTGSVSASLAGEMETLLAALALRSASSPAAVPQRASRAFADLVRRFPALADLDPLAIERVLARGPNVSHMKGQLLEEMLEQRIVTWLRDPAGKAALGLDDVAGDLHFVPGDLVRDARNVQLTDGIIFRVVNGAYEIVAIFECKAGSAAARELRLASGGNALTVYRRGRLSAADEAELLAYARDILRDRQEQAAQAGITISDTIETVLGEISLSELGGQISRDMNRLAPNAVGSGSPAATTLRIAGETRQATLGRRVRFFGVVPGGFNTSGITRELRRLGYNFDIMPMPITARQINDAARRLVSALSQ